MLISHLIVFFAANFVGFFVNADRRNPIAGLLILAVPIAAVYFVGWWALLTALAGLVFGGYVYWNGRRGASRDQPNEHDS